MKILFANPPWWTNAERLPHAANRLVYTAGVRAGSRWPFTHRVHSSPDQYVLQDYLPFPYFLSYASSYVLQKTEATVLFRDSIAMRESYRNFFTYVKQQRPDYLVIESATPSWEHDSKLLAELKRRWANLKIILTGPITSKSQEIMAQHPVHACVRGEYEKGVVRVLNGEEGIIDYDLLSKQEMNAAPFPHIDPKVAHHYWDCNPRGQVWPQAQVLSSRGCPYKCIFCVWPATMTGNDPDGSGSRTVRHYTPEYMEEFLREIVHMYGYKSIYFDDDTFNLGSRHVRNMCKVMRKIGLPWSAMCRADTSKMELWKEMRDSGCFGVKLGFESGDQYVVDKIVNKHLDLEYAKSVVHHLKDLGMTVHGTFTYGLPGETPAQMRKTQEFIDSLPFDSIQQSGTAEIEGTPLATLYQEGKLAHYEGAQIDEHYDRSNDGNQKWLQLVAAMRDN